MPKDTAGVKHVNAFNIAAPYAICVQATKADVLYGNLMGCMCVF